VPMIFDDLELLRAEPRLLLEEGPVWDENTHVLYWVDIERGEVPQCLADGSEARVTGIGERIGCLALRPST
jgi:sugar lactone lactonase YvrE